jgi:hypothetical protein
MTSIAKGKYRHLKRGSRVVMTSMDRAGSDHYRVRQAPPLFIRHRLPIQLTGLSFHASMFSVSIYKGSHTNDL